MTKNMLIKVKMPTIVGILTFISMIHVNTASDIFKAKNVFFRHLSLYFKLSSFEHENRFITSGPGQGPGMAYCHLQLLS